MVKQLTTGELAFDSHDESSLYFAKLLAEASKVDSTNTDNQQTYKSKIIELRNVSYSIPAGKVLSNNIAHSPTPFWAIAESLSEMLNLSRPIQERYTPEIMEANYKIFPDRQPCYAYGERLHVFNQVWNIFEKLRKNPTTKKAVMSIYQGFDTSPHLPDAPCTIGWNLRIRDNQLDIGLHMRSWDFFAGGTYDPFLANVIVQSFASWLRAEGQPELQPGRIHFYADSLHYYPERSQSKLEKMLEVGETNFYSDVEPFSFSGDMKQYYMDMHHLSDAEQASYNGNFEYSDKKLKKIKDPTIRDFTRMFMIKNARTYKKPDLVAKYQAAVELPEIRKWLRID